MTENMTRQKKLFTEMPVWKAIAAFGGPSVAVILVMILYNMADMFFVGMTGDTAQVAAVSLASPVFSIAMALGAMIGGGASILISARLGQKDYSAVRTYSAVAAWWSLFLGLVLGIGVFLFRTPLIYAIGANDEIYPYSVAYAGILCTGMPAMIFTTSVGNIVRAEGAIKESFLGSILPTLINLALDPVFILGLHMGAAGAAIATVIANYVGLLYFVFYFLKGNTSCNPRLPDRHQHPARRFCLRHRKPLSRGLRNKRRRGHGRRIKSRLCHRHDRHRPGSGPAAHDFLQSRGRKPETFKRSNPGPLHPNDSSGSYRSGLL